MKIKISNQELRVLHFDVETAPVWYGPGDTTRSAIVVFSYSFRGEGSVATLSQHPWGVREYNTTLRRMSEHIRELITQPNLVLTGHYIEWADLPWINNLMYRTGLPPVGNLMIQDTGKLAKMKGVPKSLGEMIAHFDIEHPKVQMMEGDWQHLDLVRLRCEQDVLAHKKVYAALKEGGYLKPPKVWRP